MNLLEALARHLDALGLVTWDLPGTDVFLEHLPSSPDEVVVVAGYGGMDSNAGQPWDHPRVQIRARGTADPRVSRDRLQGIYDALHGLSHTTLPGDVELIDCIGLQSSPQYLERDQNGRHQHVLNFELDVTNPARTAA